MLTEEANRLESLTPSGFAGYGYNEIASEPTHYNYFTKESDAKLRHFFHFFWGWLFVLRTKHRG